MRGIHLGPKADEFIWAGGIEDTFIPQTRPGHRALDEYQLMGHYQNWREDLSLAGELGLNAIRWGVPWYRVQPYPSDFDWSWTDKVIPFLVEELGITPIIDLMHYGCPFWLRREFAGAEYPSAVAAYASAFATRYSSLIKWYTPLNEPLINALFCGKRGLWPPYLKGDAGYIRMMVQIVKGILNTVEAIREVDPEAKMVHVEAAGLNRAARQDLQVLAIEEQRRGFLCYDLLTGRLTSDHPLFPWLVLNGASPDDLAEISGRGITLDVMGMNFYPQWSTQQLYVNSRGKLAYRPVETDGAGFAALIEDYYKRYKVPIIITETSAKGNAAVRSHWLETAVATIKALRTRGVPVHGLTWFPITTMIDWQYRTGNAPVEDYYLDLGLYRLGRAEGEARWVATPLVEQLRGFIRNPAEAVGDIGD